jgi:hypothetical protein
MKKNSLEIEKQLLPRLKNMGFLLFFMALVTVTYAFFSKPYLSTVGLDKELPNSIETEALGPLDGEDTPTFMLTSYERINLYFIASVFAGVGAFCFFFFWKKRAKLHALQEQTLPAELPQEEKK